MKKVMLIGEAMVLLIAEDIGKLEDISSFKKAVSGAELNVAIGLKRLDFDVEYVSKFGDDALGRYVYNFLKKENISTNYIEIDDKNNTGIQFKSRVENGDPDIFYIRKNSAASKIDIEYLKKIDLSTIDLIHITGIPLAISESFRKAILFLIEKAKENNIYITFDPNIRLQMWENREDMIKIFNEVSKKVDLILPGVNECEILINETKIEKIVEKYRKMGVKKVVIKDGANGSYYADNDKIVFSKSFKVENIVDTVGAGDGFAVGIISAILENLSIEEMLRRANAIGSIQIRNISDNEGLPTRKELSNYLFEKE